jgi:hypothetical protein
MFSPWFGVQDKLQMRKRVKCVLFLLWWWHNDYPWAEFSPEKPSPEKKSILLLYCTVLYRTVIGPRLLKYELFHRSSTKFGRSS